VDGRKEKTSENSLAVRCRIAVGLKKRKGSTQDKGSGKTGVILRDYLFQKRKGGYFSGRKNTQPD